MSCVWTSPSGSLLYTSHLNCLSVGQNFWPEKFVLFRCNEVDKMFFVLTAKLKSSLTDLFYFIFTKNYNKMMSLWCELLFLWTIYFSDLFQLRLPWSTVNPLLVPIWWCQSRYGSWTEMSHNANIVHVCSNSLYFTKMRSTAIIQTSLCLFKMTLTANKIYLWTLLEVLYQS